MTSTLGWRTLQAFRQSPLQWIDDVDADGNAELIIWDSFPIFENPSMASFGLMAWVYRPVSPELLLIDWALSRRMARELAQAYRMPLRTGSLTELRAKAAEALELFAREGCTSEPQRRHTVRKRT